MDSVRFRNFNYLQETLGFKASANPVNFQRCMRVMDEYTKKGNDWWIKHRGDDVKLAYFQLSEPCLLISTESLKTGTSKVLGRNVDYDELSFNNKALKDEFYKKYPQYRSKIKD